MNGIADNLCVNAIRFLSVDAINKAKSGHPGIALGAAPIIHTLFTRHLVIDPENPNWYNRDRFILSAGHGSSMLYSTLHLSGYDISIDDLKEFRQFGSKTPGHPEVFHTPGVEVTTGPLGQGIAMGVGMAIAEKHLAAKFNKADNKIIDHYTYVLCGDGCLQEGVAQEAMSLAGTLNLNKLIILYDSNDIQLDGEVSLANTESVKEKYEAMHFSYFKVEDGNDVAEVEEAINLAKKSNKPSIIEIKTVIGYGSVNAGDCSVHGAPLGEANTVELRNTLEWPYEPFEIPAEAYQFYNQHVILRGDIANTKWNKQLSDYCDEYPEDFHLLEEMMNGEIQFDPTTLNNYEVGYSDATRNTCSYCVAEISRQNPTFIGGCADLTKTTNARGANGNFTAENPFGRNICYGVREHAMGAIVNGLTLHGLRGFGGGFLVFSDYMKPAIRLAALMNIPSLFIFSHNSPLVGEDGPTHQPIEHLTMLRSIPNCNVINPCDPNETNYAFRLSQETTNNPVVITTTRQKVTTLENTSYEGFKHGAYIIRKENGHLDGVIIAAGAEVELAINVAKKLESEGKNVRVVSMPSMFMFDQQSNEYKEQIIPTGVKNMAIEMAHSMSWYKYSRNVYGVDRFGLSAPAKYVQEELGFTIEKVLEYYKSL